MSSIVWRWNHPHNLSQQTTRGYPNDKLWTDLVYFHTMYNAVHKARLEAEDARLDKATKQQHDRIAEEQERLERLERNRLREEEYKRQQAEREARREQEEKEREANLLVTNADKQIQERQQLTTYLCLTTQKLPSLRICATTMDCLSLMVISLYQYGIFLLDIRRRMAYGNELTPNQLQTLKNICSNEPLTDKQERYLENLGYEGSLSA